VRFTHPRLWSAAIYCRFPPLACFGPQTAKERDMGQAATTMSRWRLCRTPKRRQKRADFRRKVRRKGRLPPQAAAKSDDFRRKVRRKGRFPPQAAAKGTIPPQGAAKGGFRRTSRRNSPSWRKVRRNSACVAKHAFCTYSIFKEQSADHGADRCRPCVRRSRHVHLFKCVL